MQPSPTVTELATQVRSGARSALDVVDEALERIAEHGHVTNAFCALDPDGARAQARAVDALIADGADPGPLAGVPVGVKDLEHARGFTTVFGDPARASDAPSAVDSVEVARLRAAGAIVVGKTNTPAYGFHAETDNLVYGPTRNPWATDRTSGGSSGGSAAAVAAGLVPLCTGSDGGGSIRVPSAVCGISGFKVTHGVVPNGDATAPTWGPFSTRGPMARTFAEIAVGLDVVKGLAPSDLLSLELSGSFVDAAERGSLDGLRIAWSPTLGVAHPDAAVVAACEAALATLEAAGARVVETLDTVFPEPPVLAWVARAAPGSLRTASLDPMPWDERFLPAALNTARYGEHATAASMLDGEAGAHAANLALCAIWERVDVLVTPGMATVPPLIGTDSPYGPAWAADYTLPFNLVRSPASVVHCGFVDADGTAVPVALQFAMPRCADLRLMGVSAAAERALGGVPRPPA